jgi:acyl-CoA dehydrogenase
MLPFCDPRREELRGRVEAFASRLPRVAVDASLDKSTALAVLSSLAEAELLPLVVPAAFGGGAPQVDALSLVVVREALAGMSTLHDVLFAVQGLAAHPLVLGAEPSLANQWLPSLACGRAIGAFAATEPEAGSDLTAMTTTAVRQGDSYLLNGHKIFISNAGIADVYIVFARQEGLDSFGGPRLSAFAVPAETPGLQTHPMELMAAHSIGGVWLRDLRIPAAFRLGQEGDGLSLCLSTLELYRPTVGAAACGMAMRAFDETKRRVQVRKQFGQTLAYQPTVRSALADMATNLEAARGLVYRAAWYKEQPDASAVELRRLTSMAKLHATETACTVVDQALQLHGAAGLVRGGVMERLYRDVRALRIYEGTSEIQKLLVARTYLGGK